MITPLSHTTKFITAIDFNIIVDHLHATRFTHITGVCFCHQVTDYHPDRTPNYCGKQVESLNHNKHHLSAKNNPIGHQKFPPTTLFLHITSKLRVAAANFDSPPILHGYPFEPARLSWHADTASTCLAQPTTRLRYLLPAIRCVADT